jgi:hypothetical protein
MSCLGKRARRFFGISLDGSEFSKPNDSMAVAETTITPGAKILITDAFGDEHPALALSLPESDGHSFPVVWVKTETEERVPWPLEAVRLSAP